MGHGQEFHSDEPNVFLSLFAFFSGLLNDFLLKLFLPAPPTLQLMTPGTWISTEGYRPFKCESFTKTLRFVFCRLLALFGIYIYIFVATDNSLLQPRPRSPGRFSLALELWKSALGTRLLWPRLTAVNVGVPNCVTKQRSRDTARRTVWVIVFQICRSLNCEERLPLLVFDSVF